MLTIQLVPNQELRGLNSDQKVGKIMKIVKQHKLTILEGKLTPHEEALLIQKTMEEISKDFKGVEICSVDYANSTKGWVETIREKMINMLTNGRSGMTIIGPASVIKQIKRNPKKIELLTSLRR
jgi:hypothetical protein